MTNSKLRVLLTRRWPQAVEDAMAQDFELRVNQDNRPMTDAELAEGLAWADVLCPTVTDSVSAELLGAPNVRARLLANFGVGFNHIDMAAAKTAGVLVTNTPGVLTDATAEIAMTLLLNSARRAGEGERLVRSGRWQGWHPTHMLSTQVTGKTVGHRRHGSYRAGFCSTGSLWVRHARALLRTDTPLRCSTARSARAVPFVK